MALVQVRLLRLPLWRISQIKHSLSSRGKSLSCRRSKLPQICNLKFRPISFQEKERPKRPKQIHQVNGRQEMPHLGQPHQQFQQKKLQVAQPPTGREAKRLNRGRSQIYSKILVLCQCQRHTKGSKPLLHRQVQARSEPNQQQQVQQRIGEDIH